MHVTNYVIQGLRIDYKFLEEHVPDFVAKLEARDREKHKLDVVIDMCDARFVYMGRILLKSEDWFGFPKELDLISESTGKYAAIASEISGLLADIGAPWFEMQVFKNMSLWAFTCLD